LKKIQNLIEIIKTKNVNNPGAYLRTLINMPNQNIPEENSMPLPAHFNEGLNMTKQILTINEPRLSKMEIINKMILEGKNEEATTLKKLWKI
jgi:hypothetical protein